MELMIIVSSREASPILAGLARACNRRGLEWACFCTSHGVQVLGDHGVRQALEKATNSMACELSWSRYMGDARCPVELGSQTEHSALAGRAARVVSL